MKVNIFKNERFPAFDAIFMAVVDVSYDGLQYFRPDDDCSSVCLFLCLSISQMVFHHARKKKVLRYE